MPSGKERLFLLLTLLFSLLLLAVQWLSADGLPPPVRVLQPDVLAAARVDDARPRASTRAAELDLLRRRVLLTGDLAAAAELPSVPRGEDGSAAAAVRLTAESLQRALRSDAAVNGGKVWDVEAMSVKKALGAKGRANHGQTENAAAWKPHVTLVVLGSDAAKLPTIEQLLVLRKATRKALILLEPPSSTLSQADLAVLARDATKAHAADLIIDMKHEEVHARGIEELLIAELHKHWPVLMQGAT